MAPERYGTEWRRDIGSAKVKHTRLNPISKKKQAIIRQENILRDEMLVDCQGKCMICGKFKPLEKNHTRYRKRFVMSCRECHSPGGVHKYLQGGD